MANLNDHPTSGPNVDQCGKLRFGDGGMLFGRFQGRPRLVIVGLANLGSSSLRLVRKSNLF
ncbi:hypothetical protein, partial [Caballeronia glebae]|uniref:hypothetical protein n=1 Tax=Caballeronia glebae TaxID=1777143 RepID=UPI001F462F86